MRIFDILYKKNIQQKSSPFEDKIYNMKSSVRIRQYDPNNFDLNNEEHDEKQFVQKDMA